MWKKQELLTSRRGNVDEHDTSLMSTTHRWWARHKTHPLRTRLMHTCNTNEQRWAGSVSSNPGIKQYCTCGCVISIHQTILIHTNVFSDDGDKWNSNEYSTSTDKFIPVTWLPKYLTQNQSYEYTTKATKACNKQQVKCKELLNCCSYYLSRDTYHRWSSSPCWWPCHP